MKKVFFIATVAVSSLVMVSCDAEAIEGSTSQSKEKNSIPFVSSNTANASEGGPGNEVIIVTPPKTP
jgi:hypothetical protein